jgi:hypothetical protein
VELLLALGRFADRYVGHSLHYGTEPCARLTNEPVGSGIIVPEGGCCNRCGKPDLAIPYSGVDTKEACNKDDNYHYADDVENVHCVLRLRYGDFNMKARHLNRKCPGLTLSSVVH